jgi:hypothetical protein
MATSRRNGCSDDGSKQTELLLAGSLTIPSLSLLGPRSLGPTSLGPVSTPELLKDDALSM